MLIDAQKKVDPDRIAYERFSPEDRTKGVFGEQVTGQIVGRVIEQVDPVEGKTAKRIKIVAITAGESDNKRNYSAQVLREATPLFADIPIFVNHPQGFSSSHDFQTLVGDLQDPSFNSRQERVEGIVDFLENIEIADNTRQVALQKPHLLGFSIFAEGEFAQEFDDEGNFVRTNVTKLTRILSTDAVDFPAAGGETLSIEESTQNPRPPTSAGGTGPKEVEEPMNEISKDKADLMIYEAKAATQKEAATTHEGKTRVLVQEHKEQTTKLEGRLSESTDKVTKLEAQVAEQATQLEAAKTELETAKTDLADSEKKVAAAESRDMIDEVLAESDLPKTGKDKLRKLAAKTPFERKQFEETVAEHREYLVSVGWEPAEEDAGIVGAGAADPNAIAESGKLAGGLPKNKVVAESREAAVEMTSRFVGALGLEYPKDKDAGQAN